MATNKQKALIESIYKELYKCKEMLDVIPDIPKYYTSVRFNGRDYIDEETTILNIKLLDKKASVAIKTLNKIIELIK